MPPPITSRWPEALRPEEPAQPAAFEFPQEVLQALFIVLPVGESVEVAPGKLLLHRSLPASLPHIPKRNFGTCSQKTYPRDPSAITAIVVLSV